LKEKSPVLKSARKFVVFFFCEYCKFGLSNLVKSHRLIKSGSDSDPHSIWVSYKHIKLLDVDVLIKFGVELKKNYGPYAIFNQGRL
jgi:hypothetical protein